MPTDLGRRYEIDWRGDPPHMLATDVPIWYRFLEVYGNDFQNLYYDCLLGGPFFTREELEDPMKKMWRANVSKRADAIAELPDGVWIIEVAKGPGLRAIGQLLTYRGLWLEDPKINKLEKMVLVCEVIDQDLIAAAAQVGILTYVMPPPAQRIGVGG